MLTRVKIVNHYKLFKYYLLVFLEECKYIVKEKRQMNVLAMN